MPTLVGVDVCDDPDRWRAVGFDVGPDGGCRVGAVLLHLVAPPEGGRTGVTGWRFHGLTGDGGEVDGIPTATSSSDHDLVSGPAPDHPVGATTLDHIVVTTPDLARTVGALEGRGLTALRERPTEAGGRPVRQVFLRPGEAIVEVVGPPEPSGPGPARFFGLAFAVVDLDGAADLLGDHLGQARDAVQPGRRIATVRSSAGLGVPVALMSPELMSPEPGG